MIEGRFGQRVLEDLIARGHKAELGDDWSICEDDDFVDRNVYVVLLQGDFRVGDRHGEGGVFHRRRR